MIPGYVRELIRSRRLFLPATFDNPLPPRYGARRVTAGELARISKWLK